MAKTKKQFNKEYYEKHREVILDKRKKHREQFGQKQYPANRKTSYRKWYIKNQAGYLAKKRKYSRTATGRQCQLKRLYRFIDKHPFISGRYLEDCERWIQVNERTISMAGL